MTAKSADIPPTIGMELLQFARASAEAKITGQPLPAPPKAGLPGPLNEPRGLFVTFHVAGQLRGCIGTFVPDRPLVPLIQDMALRSLRDPRFLFNPIRPDELGKLDVELSILSPMWPSRDPLAEFVPGTHASTFGGNPLVTAAGIAVIEAIEQDFDDRIQFAVVLDDDPGREFGMMRQPGHRFFFSPEEVEPVEDGGLA